MNSPVTGEFPAQMASNAEMFPSDDVIMSSTCLHDGVVPIESRCVNKAKHVLLIYWFVLIAAETSTRTGAVDQYFRRISKGFTGQRDIFQYTYTIAN